MPDPLAHLLDEIDAAAAGMPSGPYGVYQHGAAHPWLDQGYAVTALSGAGTVAGDEMLHQHAVYFAKLDREVVQALVRLARVVEQREVLIGADPLGFDEDEADRMLRERHAAQRALRAIAAERAGAGE